MGIDKLSHAQKYQQLPAVTSLSSISVWWNQMKPVDLGRWHLHGRPCGGHVSTSRWFYSKPPTIASPYLCHTHVTYVHDESQIPASKFARGLGRMLRKEACLLNRALCLIKAGRFEIWNQTIPPPRFFFLQITSIIPRSRSVQIYPNLAYPYISHDIRYIPFIPILYP